MESKHDNSHPLEVPQSPLREKFIDIMDAEAVQSMCQVMVKLQKQMIQLVLTMKMILVQSQVLHLPMIRRQLRRSR